MRDHASYALQSDPDRNRHFTRRWSEPAEPAARISAERIKLIEVPGAFSSDGEPRAALLVPPAASSISRRPALRMFASVAAAIAAKRSMEGGK
jgi:hypothetical protein